jgi:hypothetical protein
MLGWEFSRYSGVALIRGFIFCVVVILSRSYSTEEYYYSYVCACALVAEVSCSIGHRQHFNKDFESPSFLKAWVPRTGKCPGSRKFVDTWCIVFREGRDGSAFRVAGER